MCFKVAVLWEREPTKPISQALVGFIYSWSVGRFCQASCDSREDKFGEKTEGCIEKNRKTADIQMLEATQAESRCHLDLTFDLSGSCHCICASEDIEISSKIATFFRVSRRLHRQVLQLILEAVPRSGRLSCDNCVQMQLSHVRKVDDKTSCGRSRTASTTTFDPRETTSALFTKRNHSR